MPDIFQLAEQKLREKESHALNFDENNDSAVDLLETVILVCGSVACGKTSLIQRFMETSQEDSKTLALEYRYATRMKNNKKEVASVWELGSGAKMVKLISTSLSLEFIENSSLLIFMDLTNPSQLPQMVFDIVQNITEKTTTILKTINNTNPERYDRIQKIMAKFNDHKDASLMNVFPFPITFVAARYDQYQNMESEKKKLIYKECRR
uniref:Cytoplasmic dynein 2 light intermediate chain 1 n=1 Tax=Panagrolaimus superbus TaxID=310955 RepID=A0A914Z107_9BILA